MCELGVSVMFLYPVFHRSSSLPNVNFATLGNSRKYPYTTTDSFNILTPLTFRNSEMRYPPMISEFHNYC